VAPFIAPEVMFPFPSKVRLPMNVTGELMAAISLAIIAMVYTPERLETE
jgi:hypothetical protein